ncbi:hypothetical protein E6W39_21930 [Kitasatospora acidiphila]|uniref:Uncharacterized protein n=1 Tax=Kitasatospora acidiphila TaxID=2567942 RepID=A0A540W5Y1_9ACTN|nr:hypothetical protein [Kitasatospora acidiphila]TQF04393.1 hypothetical protein E6W39_21930 [Kitasatospora acidiphila]
MTSYNEISGGHTGAVVQAGVIHGGVQISSGPAVQTASLVTAWTGPNIMNCPMKRSSEPGGHHFHAVVAYNAGIEPVHGASVCVPAPDANLLPGEQPLMLVPVGLIPPGARLEVEIGDQGQFEPQFAVPLEIHFTDAHGVSWSRDDQSRLRSYPDQ